VTRAPVGAAQVLTQSFQACVCDHALILLSPLSSSGPQRQKAVLYLAGGRGAKSPQPAQNRRGSGAPTAPLYPGLADTVILEQT